MSKNTVFQVPEGEREVRVAAREGGTESHLLCL